MKSLTRPLASVVLAALPSFVTAQEYYTNLTTGSLTLSALANWEDGNALTNAATDLRFFVTGAASDLVLGGAYTINNDLTGLTLSNLTLDGQSNSTGRSVAITGNAIALSSGATLVLGNQGSSGGNAFGYTISAPVTLNGGLTVSGSPSNAGSVTFSTVTLPSTNAEFASGSSNRVSLNDTTLAANYTFSGAGTGGFTLGGTVTLSGNRVITVNGNTTPTLGGTITDGASSYSITKEGTGILTLSGVNHTFDGGVVVNGGTLALTAAAGTINHSPGGVTVNNGSTVRLDWSGTPSSPVVSTAIGFGSGGGTFDFGISSGNPVAVTQSGSITGSGPLTILARNGKDSLVFSGDNSAYTGAITILSATPFSPTNRQGVEFSGADAVFGADGTPDITIRDGGLLRLSSSVTSGSLGTYTFGVRGGIMLTGASGAFDSSVTDPFAVIGRGGAIVLDSRASASSSRWGDSIPVSLNSQSLQVIGRDNSSPAVNESVGAMTVSGGSHLFLNRSNASAGVAVTAASLAVTSGAGNSLLIQTGTAGDFGDPATTGVNALVVSGTKPTVTNGMITPAIQHYAGGNTLGNFLTFSGNNLVAASTVSTFNTSVSTEIVNLSTGTTLGGNEAAHAVRVGSGTLNLGGFRLSIGSGGLILTNLSITNGTLDFGAVGATIGAYNAAGQGTISAAIETSAGVTILGTTQTVNFSGTNSNFTGGIFVNGGTARFTTAAANGNNVTVGPFGRLVVGTSSGGETDIIGGLSGYGTVSSWMANSGTTATGINISPSAGTFTFEGQLANGNGSPRPLNVTKSGNGTQVFGSASFATYTGTTTVTNGVLRIDGNFSAATGNVSVTGGTLGGTGTIGGATTIGASGTLAPGASPGLLTFGSTLSLGGAAIFELDGATRGAGYDAVDVGGLLTYGGTMTVDVGFTLVDALYTFDLFDFSSQTGTFSQITLAGNQAGTLNTGNAWATQSGGYTWTFDFASGDLTAAVVPEPAAYAALASLLVLAVAARRRARVVQGR